MRLSNSARMCVENIFGVHPEVSGKIETNHARTMRAFGEINVAPARVKVVTTGKGKSKRRVKRINCK